MTVPFNINAEVLYETDVFIAGGGPAGIAAAIAAAQNGARVLLCEYSSCLGGMGTAGFVPAFMTFSDGVNLLISGTGSSILERMREENATGFDKSYSINPEALKRVYDAMLSENNVEFLLTTQLIGVNVENKRITAAILFSKNGIFAVKANVFIDATGDGDLAAFAGCEYKIGNENGATMPATLCSLWTGKIDWSKFDKASHNRRLEAAIKDGLFTVPDHHLPGIWRAGQRLFGLNAGHAYGIDGLDARSVTKALVEQRRLLTEYKEFYDRYCEGFDELELAATGMMGIRDTRRITGEYILGFDDYLNRASFDDEIGRYCYPIDIHRNTTDSEEYKALEKELNVTYKYKPGESYGIPYRALVPKGIVNLLTSGRCISTDHMVQASVRVMPCCFLTGEAVGAAAALNKKGDTSFRELDYKELQNVLKNMGAFLPNYKS